MVNTYDEKGNQTATITNPEITVDAYKVGKDSIVTTNEYDKNGNLIKSTDGEGNQYLGTDHLAGAFEVHSSGTYAII